MRILFIKLRHIGDSLLLTPTIAATKQKFPHAEIWVLVRQSCGGILAGCPEIDRILETANPDSSKRTRWGWLSDLRLAALLRRTHFDHVFELTDNDRARFLAIAARTPSRCTNEHRTLKAIWRPFFDFISKTKRYPKHQVVRDYTCPAEALCLDPNPGPLRFGESRMVPWKPEKYGNGEPFAVIHAHTRWPEKSWPMDRWESLAGQLLEFVPGILFSCGPGSAEVESAHAICAAFPGRAETTAGSASWVQLAWLLRRASFFVGVDTAAMHLAAACGCPTVALFGPTKPYEFHPWKVRHWMVRPQNWLGSKAAANLARGELIGQIGTAAVLGACREAWDFSLSRRPPPRGPA